MDKYQKVLAAVHNEILRARGKFPAFHSGHEGWATIQEEVDEIWEDVKSDNIEHARKEAIQVAAMAVCFVLEARRPERVNGNNDWHGVIEACDSPVQGSRLMTLAVDEPVAVRPGTHVRVIPEADPRQVDLFEMGDHQ